MKHKHLLKLASIPVLLVGLTALSQAQTATPPASTDSPAKKEYKHGQKHAEKMKEALGLSDAQVSQMKAIFQSEKEELSALKGNSSLSKEDKHAQFKAIREKYKPQITAILTPEQQAKMKELREQRHAEKSAGAPATT